MHIWSFRIWGVTEVVARPPATRCFLFGWFRSWRWRWYVPPKRRFTYGLHGDISQKMVTFISEVLHYVNINILFTMFSNTLSVCRPVGQDHILSSSSTTLSLSSSMSLQLTVGPWPPFPVFRSYSQSIGFLARRTSPTKGLYLHIAQQIHRINVHTDIHASSGIRTHDLSVWAGENSSYLRRLGHYDWQDPYFIHI
jgi:hypothetical protein